MMNEEAEETVTGERSLVTLLALKDPRDRWHIADIHRDLCMLSEGSGLLAPYHSGAIPLHTIQHRMQLCPYKLGSDLPIHCH